MAKMITVDNKMIDIYPINGKKFTIEEIHSKLGGLVQPLFISKVWVFYNIDALRMGYAYNQKASEVLKVPVHGSAIFVEEINLADYFFISGATRDKEGNLIKSDLERLTNGDFDDPDENDYYDDDDELTGGDFYSDYNESEFENNKTQGEIKYEDVFKLLNIEYSKKMSESEKFNMVSSLVDMTYDTVFNLGYDFKDLNEHKILMEHNGQKITVDYTHQYVKLIEFAYENLLKREHFEKCEQILDFLNYIRK